MLYANVCLLLLKPYSTEQEDYVSKVIDVFQRTYSCLLDTLKRNTRFPLLLFLCTEQFTYTNLFTFFCRTGQLRTCKIYIAYVIYYCICFPLCAHILYFDSPKFSIQLFSLIYFTVSFVRQRDEYEIVIETRPIKTSLHNQLSLPRC